MEGTPVKVNQKRWKEGGALPSKQLLKDENLRRFFAFCWTQGSQPPTMKSAKTFISWCLRENRLPTFIKENVHLYKDSFGYCCGCCYGWLHSIFILLTFASTHGTRT